MHFALSDAPWNSHPNVKLIATWVPNTGFHDTPSSFRRSLACTKVCHRPLSCTASAALLACCLVFWDPLTALQMLRRACLAGRCGLQLINAAGAFCQCWLLLCAPAQHSPKCTN